MDSFKLGIFLMVIVSSAALGSGNEASKEDTKQTKRLIEPKEDDASSTKRGIGAGTVISVSKFGLDVLTKILDVLGNVQRKLAIGVENSSGQDWEALNVYYLSGTSDAVLPKEVPTDKVLLYDARKTSGPVARGCVGVIAYYIPGLDKTLSVMFSVPYDYNLYSNWWNVALTDGKKEASKSTYEDMYYGKPFKGNNAWHVKDVGSGLKIEGSMASSGTATLNIRVKQA